MPLNRCHERHGPAAKQRDLLPVGSASGDGALDGTLNLYGQCKDLQQHDDNQDKRVSESEEEGIHLELIDRGLCVLLSHSHGTKDVVESPASIKAVTLELQTPVKFVKRIGARIGEGLHERGIETVEDLLYHLPFRYEDRLHPKPLSAYQPGEMASVIGEVRGTVLLRTRSGPIFEMTVGVAPIPPVAPIPHVIGTPDTVILSEAARSRAAKSKNPEDVRPTDAASAFPPRTPRNHPSTASFAHRPSSRQ